MVTRSRSGWVVGMSLCPVRAIGRVSARTDGTGGLQTTCMQRSVSGSNYRKKCCIVYTYHCRSYHVRYLDL